MFHFEGSSELSMVGGFGAAVADAVGVEVGQDLAFPGAESAAEPGDLGDRTGVEAV
jgi:hypothetical protein